MSNKKRFISVMLIFIIIISSVFTSGCSQKETDNGEIPDGKGQSTTEGNKNNIDDTWTYEGEIYDVTNEQTAAFSLSVSDFSAKLFNSYASGSENVLLSPLSVMIALAMVANGANGQTEKQITDALCNNITLDELNVMLNNYVAAAWADNKKTLRLASSAWFNNNRVVIAEEYEKIIKKYYTDDIFGRTFDNEAIDEINEWVRNRTCGKINKLLDDVDFEALLYIVNTILFSANWSEVTREIKEDEFTAADGTKQNVHYLNFSAVPSHE